MMQSSAGCVGQGTLSILLSVGKGLVVFRSPEGQSSQNHFSPCVGASAAFSFCVVAAGDLVCCAPVHSAGSRFRWRITVGFCSVEFHQMQGRSGFFSLTRMFFHAVLGGEFLKYMDAFKPFLGIGLKNYAEYQVESKQGCPALAVSKSALRC